MTRILVVDDNYDIAFMIGEKLRHFVGGEIETARSGEAALERIRAAPPDLVILDICMPVVDGYEVCRMLKADSRTAEVPVIFITSTYNDLRSRIKGLDLGADDYIVQPVDDLELVTRVKAVLRIKMIRDELADAKKAMGALQAEHIELCSQLSECCQTVLDHCQGGTTVIPSAVLAQARLLLRRVEATACPESPGQHADNTVVAVHDPGKTR